MVVNFRARGINRGARKLARTPTLIQKKRIHYEPSIPFKSTTLLASSNPLENFIYFSHINSSHHFTY